MDQINLDVPQISDGHFLRVVIDKAAPATVATIRYNLFSSPSTGREAPLGEIQRPDTQLGRIIAMEGTICRDLAVDFGGGGTVSLSRTHSPNRVAVHSFRDEMFALELYAQLKTALAAFQPGVPFADVFGADIAKYYAAREATVTRLEDSVSHLLRRATEDLQNREKFFLEKEKALELKIEERIKGLDAERAAERIAHEKKEADLAARLKDVDDRGAKFARRALQERLKGEIKNRQTKSELTLGTRRMRWPIAIAVGLLAVILGAAFAVYSKEIIAELAKPTPTSYVLGSLVVRQILVGIALGGSIWYFIHWQNQWFQRHADEEFKIKRLELDVDRASWVVELAMEWAKETNGKDLPPVILSELSKNLFNDGPSPNAGGGRDHLVSELLGASTKTEIAIGDSKFTLDRKAAAKMKSALEKI